MSIRLIWFGSVRFDSRLFILNGFHTFISTTNCILLVNALQPNEDPSTANSSESKPNSFETSNKIILFLCCRWTIRRFRHLNNDLVCLMQLSQNHFIFNNTRNPHIDAVIWLRFPPSMEIKYHFIVRGTLKLDIFHQNLLFLFCFESLKFKVQINSFVNHTCPYWIKLLKMLNSELDCFVNSYYIFANIFLQMTENCNFTDENWTSLRQNPLACVYCTCQSNFEQLMFMCTATRAITSISFSLNELFYPLHKECVFAFFFSIFIARIALWIFNEYASPI